jgi:hypothetical protein
MFLRKPLIGEKRVSLTVGRQFCFLTLVAVHPEAAVFGRE